MSRRMVCLSSGWYSSMGVYGIRMRGYVFARGGLEWTHGPQCFPVIGRLGNFFHCRVLDCGCMSIEITPLKSCTTLAH